MTLTSSLISLVIIVTCLIAVIIFNSKRSTKAKERKLQQGLEWLTNFRQLLAFIQQHRGLTNGFINGDESLLANISPLQQKINQQITALNNQGQWVHNNDYWLGIADHWLRLSKRFSKSAAPVNYDQHNNLIASLLYLIEECAENHQLQELCVKEGYDASFLWQKMLYCCEYLGQLRALGTGIAAAKKSTSVQRIKLNYLRSRIEEFLKTPHFSDVESDIQLLLSTIEHDIIQTPPKIDAKDYFSLATASLDKVFSKFDQHLSALQAKHHK